MTSSEHKMLFVCIVPDLDENGEVIDGRVKEAAVFSDFEDAREWSRVFLRYSRKVHKVYIHKLYARVSLAYITLDVNLVK